MLAFLAKHPARTRNAHNNPVFFDDGRSSIEFKPPSNRYLVVNRLPPAGAPDDEVAGGGGASIKANGALAPPLHWHVSQTETFHVLQGTAQFTLDGRRHVARAGDTVTINPGVFHTFRNASGREELVVEFVLEPRARERDEAFFSE